MATRPSLDIAYNLIKERLEIQRVQVAALDGKANFGLTSATLLTTGTVGIHTALATAQKTATYQFFVIAELAIDITVIATVLTIIAFIAYVCVVYAAYRGYQLRVFKTVPDPELLLSEYLNESEAKTKAVVVETMSVVFYENEELVKDKIRWVELSLASLVIEASLLLLLTLFQIVV
jgi:hypothetical protein